MSWLPRAVCLNTSIISGVVISEPKPFGLKLSISSKPTRSLWEKVDNAIGIKIQAWAEDLEQKTTWPRTSPGWGAIEVKRWVTGDAYSFETSIEQLRELTDYKLLIQQVCIAIVRMLWHVDPLAVGCKGHSVMSGRLERDEAWALLRFVGFKTCKCSDFSHDEASDEKWCFWQPAGHSRQRREKMTMVIDTRTELGGCQVLTLSL